MRSLPKDKEGEEAPRLINVWSSSDNPWKVALLKDIRAIVAIPANWKKGCSAFDSNGYYLDSVFDERAVGFCLVGAATRVGVGIDSDYKIEVLAEALELSKHPDRAYYAVVDFNDERTLRHSQMLRILDCGIKKFDPGYVPPKKTLWAWFQSWKYKG